MLNETCNIVIKQSDIEEEEDANAEGAVDLLVEPTISIPSLRSPSLTQRFSGILYAFLAVSLFTGSAFVTKQMQVNLLDALILRCLVQTVILIIYKKFYKHYSFYRHATKWEVFFLIVNLFMMTTFFLSFFVAYHYLPLSELITIRYTQVIWTVIITSIIYREKPQTPILIAIAFTMVGVVLVAQPDFLFSKELNATSIVYDSSLWFNIHPRLLGILLSLYSALASSATIISNKHLLSTYKTKQSLIILQFTFFGFCLLIINVFVRYSSHTDPIYSMKQDFLNWRFLVASLAGLLLILSSTFAQKAIKREHPSVFNVVQSSDILFSILLQNLFTSEHSNSLSLAGSALVLISLLILSGWKFFYEKRERIEVLQ